MKIYKKNIDIKNIPAMNGVYLFKDDKDNILYVGKAKNIKKRIEQYLNGSINSYKTPILIEKTENVEYQVCENEKESLLLEQELIKKHRPYYNILFLDDKKYPYIVIKLKSNKLEFQTSFIYKKLPNTYYFGPLPPNYGYKIIKNFLIRECLYENGLPIKNNNFDYWKMKFDYAKKILSSTNKEIINKLKNQMTIASENEQYELAKDFRDIIFYLTNSQQQSITFDAEGNFDVIAFVKHESFLMIVVHNFKNGSFFMQEEFIFEINVNLYESITEFINHFYSYRNEPNFIVTNFEVNNSDLIINKKIIIPKKGKYYQAMKNCLNNIEINKELKILKFKEKININNKVKNYFSSILNKDINDLIMIDNSNENNKDVVSVIIYYKNYQPYYKNYRKYNIANEASRKSDVEYIKQGLTKYFQNNESIPDLIIVDGALAQYNEAKKVLKNFNINLPIIGLVKNEQHKTEYLLDNNKNKIKIMDKYIYNFFSKIQIEVDLFAKSFHSKKKLLTSLEGFLSTINGIGPKTEQKLLDHFKSYSNIYNASIEELKKIVPESIATKIIEKLKK